MKKGSKGPLGEEAACAFLLKKKYRILKRNFRCRYGEVDIIAYRDGEICFIEVKTWDVCEEWDLSYALNCKKKQHIINTSREFLASFNEPYESVRFDVLLIRDDMTVYDYYINAFMETDLP